MAVYGDVEQTRKVYSMPDVFAVAIGKEVSRPSWTKENPTQGWYWMRKPNTLEIVYVQCGLYVMGRIGGRSLTDEYFNDTEWAGPIPEPEE